MRKLDRFVAALMPLLLLLSGCSDQKTPTDSATPATQSIASAEDHSNGVVKIVVTMDGTVEVNSAIVPIESLASKLDSMGDIKEIWYHRASPDAAEPHRNAIKVMVEISSRKLPIAFYLDRDFTKRANIEY